MDISDFDYVLPQDRIAQYRAEPRDSSRLFHIDARGPEPVHSHHFFRELPSLMDEGDVLVLNRTKVVPARVLVRKSTGGRGEVLFLNDPTFDRTEVMVRLKGAKSGTELLTEDPSTVVRLASDLGEGRWGVEVHRGSETLKGVGLLDWMKVWGIMPTPPYIKRKVGPGDEYQTIYASEEGSIAAPTAGLHFTENVIDDLREKGVKVAEVLLHVGLGTFLPVRTRDVRDHRMLGERFIVPEATSGIIEREARSFRDGGKASIWAVGTTVMRTLESAFGPDGRLLSSEGTTELYIHPGHRFSLPYKGFITNFHLPRSTPLILTSTFHDRGKLLRAYVEAIGLDYRFFSFGDSMMIRRR
ncbi:MAG: tRNA preQ1(34) S-adenosylmethionine ribosyltransferase-isomerase QueA [Candidatus Thermoplasmatota archaeon]|jgi:S-adenosylmethionine:tRNA ribosyltransferase-isomerase|nr:tRNA preQ1(34) S-adenosylmethionine ribosyltransferase-isomerase QueA [Candidatus Thermoplasmatota archaeon]